MIFHDHHVPHLDSSFTLNQLIAHYQPCGGKVTMGSTEDRMYIVRLPRQQRIHFYGLNPTAQGPAVLLRSQGFYDRHSPFWKPEAAQI
ncbi:MAG: hypothetical protein WCI73_01700 [Phycisphaerae bacterium]